MMPQEEQALLDEIWNAKSACRSVYRDDFHAFFEDVTRERTNLLAPAKAALTPEVERIVPNAAPRAWPEQETGYSLVRLRDSILGAKKHFANGAPLLGDLRWSTRPSSRLWGFCRYSDKGITINSVLNSPDIPYFVLEYLMFHEMLHADMPSAGHNRDFRARERSYAPSAEAIEDAARRGIKAGPKAGTQFWYVSADRFLCTFDRCYLHKKPGTTMEVA